MADWLHPGFRFLHYALLLGLFGLTAFRVFGLRQIQLPHDMERGAAVLTCALLAPIVTAALMWVSIAAMMGQPVGSLEWESIEAMVISTSIGWAFIARIALLSLAAFALLSKGPRGVKLAALCYGLTLSTLGWSGHAAAAEGTLGDLHRFNDGLHLLAAGLWTGAIGWFLRLIIAAHQRPDAIAPEQLLGTMHRFAPLGVTLVAIVAGTGLINAHLIFGLGNSVQVLGTDYGWLLTAKTTLVVVMLLFAARNAAFARQRVRTDVNSTAMTLAALRASLASELLLATAVLAIVAFVGLASPMG